MIALQTRDRQMRSSVESSGSPFPLLLDIFARKFSASKKIELSFLLCLFFPVLHCPSSLPLAARCKAQALLPGLLLCLLLSTTFTSRLLASCLATTFFARLLAFMLAGTLASALASSLAIRLVAGSLASTSSTSCHLDILSHGFDYVFHALIQDRAVPDSELPLENSDPDVPEEYHAKDGQEQSETDCARGIHDLFFFFAVRLMRLAVCVEFEVGKGSSL